jgi:hypothetical protein
VAPLLKPVSKKLTDWLRKARTRTAKRKERQERIQKQRFENALIRVATFERDHRKCRAYGVRLYLNHQNPFLICHCHHKRYKSQGGSDSIENRITLSPLAHDMEHRGLLDISGEPNGTLTFTERDAYGNIVKTWEPPC